MEQRELRKITQKEFDNIYKEHQLWVNTDKKEGKRADLSFTDLREIEFPPKANLQGANLGGAILRGANLRGANLQGADLQGANLQGANLQEANLRDANLRGADLRVADLQGADLRVADLRAAVLWKTELQGAIYTPENLEGAIGLEYAIGVRPELLQSKKTSPDIQQQLNRLQVEKEQAEQEADRITKELESKDSTSAALEEELEEERGQREYEVKEYEKKIEQLTKEKDEIIDRRDEFDKALKEALDELKNVNKNLKPDFRRLNFQYVLFFLIIIGFFVLLFYVWREAFSQYSGGVKENFNVYNLWVYVSPSLILVGFIGVCISQVNKMQGRLEALKKYSRKYDIIKMGLVGYYKVETRIVERKPDKAQDVFWAIINKELEEDIDTEHEENKTKQRDSRDKIPMKALADTAIDYFQKIKGGL